MLLLLRGLQTSNIMCLSLPYLATWISETDRNLRPLAFSSGQLQLPNRLKQAFVCFLDEERENKWASSFKENSAMAWLYLESHYLYYLRRKLDI